MIMEGNQNPIFNTMKASLTRPSWAILLLIFAVLTLFTLQITNKSVFPMQQSFSLAARDSSTGFRGPKSCSGFFDEVPPRKVVKSIEEFGGVGDGKTSNTAAFRTAMAYMDRFKDRGGAQLNVPKGRWLTGNFNLTSNFTLFLDEGAVILGSQDPKEWPIIEPLPSYGRGRERQGGRHISLIHGNTIRNVVITGNRSNRCMVTKIKRLNHRIDHHLLSVTYNQLNPQ